MCVFPGVSVHPCDFCFELRLHDRGVVLGRSLWVSGRHRHYSHRYPGVPTGLQVEETSCGPEDAGWVPQLVYSVEVFLWNRHWYLSLFEKKVRIWPVVTVAGRFSSEIFTMFCQKIFMSVPEERGEKEAAEWSCADVTEESIFFIWHVYTDHTQAGFCHCNEKWPCETKQRHLVKILTE